MNHIGERSSLSQAERDGAAPYSPALLAFYDAVVLGFNFRFVWRCPTPTLQKQYDTQLSRDHLDIGVGSGYFLAHAQFPVRYPAVTLVDLNQNSLHKTAARLRRRGIDAEQYLGSALHPLPVPSGRRYTSIAANALMHCLPGTWAEKGVTFAHAATVAADDAVFFGATVLAEPTTRLSRRVGDFFNSHGAFHNADDDLPGLEQALAQSWGEVSVTLVGQTALWTARKPRRESQ